MGETLPNRGPRGHARERILDAAYELFSRGGIRAVGVEKVIDRAGVARMTLYRHYPSKDDLALDFLRRREELWTKKWLQGEVERRTPDPRERLLAIFDVFDGWFQRDDFEGCSFVNVLLETSEESPVREATVTHLAAIRGFVARLATEAGVDKPDDFARRWHILMKGSIIAACEGDLEAARRARSVGAVLLANELEGATGGRRPA